MPSDGRGSSPGIFSTIMAFLTGGSMNKLVLQEGSAPAVGAAGTDVIYADSTAHTLKVSLNGAAFATLGGATAPLTLTGSSDAVQLNIKGNATQTTNILQVSNSANAALFAVSNVGQILASDGSLSLPSIAFANDPNTGFYSSADGVINLTVDATRVELETSSVHGMANGRALTWYSAGYAQTVAGFGHVSGTSVMYATDGGAGTGWFQNSGGRARSVVNTVVSNSTNMTALSNMSLKLLAGRKYFGELKVFAKNSNAAEGLRFDFGGGNATFNSFEFGFAATPPGSGLVLGTLTSTTFNSAIVVGTATTADAVYTIPVGLTCNVAGTIIPRMAENIAAGGSATVELNSFFWLEDSPQ